MKKTNMLKLMEDQNDFIYESLKKRVEQGGVMAEVEFQRGVVIFKDAGNRMEIPIEVVRDIAKQLEIK